MMIDEARKFTLTKYATTKGGRKKTRSDHNPMVCNFSINYEKDRSGLKRKEIFNLKSSECQKQFFEATNAGFKFQKCFDGNNKLESKFNRFFKTLDDMLQKSFTRVRIKSGVRKNEVRSLIERKSKLSLSLLSIKCKLAKEIIFHEINKIEDDISKMSASRNAAIVRKRERSGLC